MTVAADIPHNTWPAFFAMLTNTASASSIRWTEPELLAVWPDLTATPNATWPKIRGMAFARALSWGYDQWFDQLIAYNGDDPAFMASQVDHAVMMAAQNWSTPGHLRMAQTCLTLSAGVPLEASVSEHVAQAIMTMRPPKGRAPGDIPQLPVVLNLVVADPRFEHVQTQYHLWQMAGEQGQPLALDVLKAWHDRLTPQGKTLAELPVIAWEGALLKALAGVNPECACAEAVDKTRAWITKEQIQSYLAWDGNRLHAEPQFWSVYDLCFHRHLAGTDPDPVPTVDWDLITVRDLMYAQAPEHMPIETARRRAEASQPPTPLPTSTRPRRSRS